MEKTQKVSISFRGTMNVTRISNAPSSPLEKSKWTQGNSPASLEKSSADVQPQEPAVQVTPCVWKQKSLCICLTAPSCYQECILRLSASTLFQYFVSSGYDGFSHCSRVQFTPNRCSRVEFTLKHNGGLRFLCLCDTEDEAFKMTSWQSFLTTPCLRTYGGSRGRFSRP